MSSTVAESVRTIERCGISDATEFHTLWKLPKLPLTERFGPYREDHSDLAFDQELVISMPTGHVQLRRQLDPQVLYTDSEYAFRTAQSETGRSGSIFFVKFLERLAAGRTFDSMVDVGGNDLFLARELHDKATHRAVIDPICEDIDGHVIDGVRVFGRFIEQVDLSRDIPQPDLLVCRHTLEHIARPKEVLLQWFRQCREDCIFVVEIPCFDDLVEAQRFDAVFHQHFQYFDLESFRALIWECGGEYIDHVSNHQVSCGGALLVAFRRASTPQPEPERRVQDRIARFERRIKAYESQLAMMHELLEELPRPVYGYGASLMLATLGYHLRTDFSMLECVLDDDAAKDGLTYENVPVLVRDTAKVRPAANASYLVTSLESVRPIYRRISQLTPRRVLVPFIV